MRVETSLSNPVSFDSTLKTTAGIKTKKELAFIWKNKASKLAAGSDKKNYVQINLTENICLVSKVTQ